MRHLGIGVSVVWSLLVICFTVAAVVGWIMNILDLIGMRNIGFDGNEFEIILRLVGIPFLPLGGILGWVW